jgi:hypothetical protein
VDLIGQGTAYHVEVLLRRGDLRFPGREQLGLGGPGVINPATNGASALIGSHFFPFTRWP